MNLKRKVGMLLALAVATTGLPLLSADIATGAVAQSGKGSIQTIGSCGGFLRETQQTTGQLILTVVVPSTDPTQNWTFAAQQQEYDAVTGQAIGDPIDLVANNTLPQMVFSHAEGGFTTTGTVLDKAGLSHGFSFTANRTSPTPLTCTGQAFWTTPANGLGPVVPPNPEGKPETAAAPTGATEADAGTNAALIQFNQPLLDTPAGFPANTQFTVQVDGVARNVTGVEVTDDPADAVVAVDFDGAPLACGQTVTVSYRKPLSSAQPHLQDFNGNPVASFGPISIPVSC